MKTAPLWEVPGGGIHLDEIRTLSRRALRDEGEGKGSKTVRPFDL